MSLAPVRKGPDRARPALVARAVTALIGGYGWAAAVAALIARLLPGARVEASTWALLLAFPLYAAILLWAYAERRLARVVPVIWGGAALFAALALLVGRPA